MDPLPPVLDEVRAYYASKIEQHGPSASGVDWNSEASQEARFRELLRVLPDDAADLLDFGCGYGALLTHLRAAGWIGRYVGFDIAGEMVETARRLHDGGRDRFTTVVPTGETFDCVVASGIFNVRLGAPHDEWQAHVERTLDVLTMLSTSAFAFNMLTAYADADRMRPDLYYADPSHYFDLCVRRYSRHVALLHDYPLYEFTILVRK